MFEKKNNKYFFMKNKKKVEFFPKQFPHFFGNSGGKNAKIFRRDGQVNIYSDKFHSQLGGENFDREWVSGIHTSNF